RVASGRAHSGNRPAQPVTVIAKPSPRRPLARRTLGHSLFAYRRRGERLLLARFLISPWQQDRIGAMKKQFLAALAVSLTVGAAAPALAAAPTHQVTTVTINGKALKVDKYTWRDSKNRLRSVSLKREGLGNPGHGGYAVQMTYQEVIGGILRTITVNAETGFDG